MSLGVKGETANEKQKNICTHIYARIIYSRITKLKAKKKENQMCLKHLLWVRFLCQKFSFIIEANLQNNQKGKIL